MLRVITDLFIQFDNIITDNISFFLEKYELGTVHKDFVYTIPLFLKFTIYLIIIIIPILILKILHPFNKTIHIMLMFLLFLIVMSAFGIFIGYFQLLYS